MLKIGYESVKDETRPGQLSTSRTDVYATFAELEPAFKCMFVWLPKS